MPELSQSPVTLILLIINVLVSGYALFMDVSVVDRFAFKPRRILEQGEYYRMLSAGFVHVDLAHLLFNMITLYFFGPLLERLLGSFEFALLYFGAELAAHGLSLYLHRSNAQYAAIGASGAISGVVFAFCLFFPFQNIYIFFALPLPAIVFAVLYVVGSIYAMRHPGSGGGGMTGGIAHEAHVGGAISGLLLTILLEPRSLSIFLSNFGL